MTGADAVFVLASAGAVVSALMVVSRRSPVTSAVAMLLSLASTAVVYLLLHATFLFVTQVLLYAGAILVLFVFVIMLLNPGPKELALDMPRPSAIALSAAASIGLLLVLLEAFHASGLAGGSLAGPGSTEPPVEFGQAGFFGLMYGTFIVPFELISVLVTAAIAAVVVLAKQKLPAPEPPPLKRGEENGGDREGAPEPEKDAALTHAGGGR